MPDTTTHDALIDQALEHHQAGRLLEAEKIYRAVLEENPRHPEALNFLGVVAMQTGNIADAEMWCARAIQSGGGPEAFNNYGETQRLQGKLPTAAAAFERAIQLDPGYGEAWCNLGLVQAQAGQVDRAVGSLLKAVQLEPQLVQAHFNLGVVFNQQGKPEQAIDAWRQALRLDPNHVEALNNIGVVLSSLGRTDEALETFQRIIEIDDSYGPAYTNAASALLASKTERHVEAVPLAQRGVDLNPDSPEALYNLADALQRSGRLDEALPIARRAVELGPNLPAAASVLAAALEKQGQSADAIAVYEAAVRAHGDDVELLSGLSAMYRANGRDREAIAVADRAIRARPDHAEAHANKAFALLANGDFLQGFAEYEWRWQAKRFPLQRRSYPQPQWSGRFEDLKDKTVLVYAEQGFGDVLQFARFIPMLADHGASVVAEVHKELAPLVATVRGVRSTLSLGGEPRAFDLHVPLLSIPHLTKVTLQTLPNQVPYFHPPDALKSKWRDRIESAREGARLRVGLVWGGSKVDMARSVKLARLASLADVAGVRLYSLQKGPAADELRAAPASMRIVDLGREFADFLDTAAAMTNLDLLISIDTAVAHVGGAMATPTWVMLLRYPDWRWMSDRADSPWYPKTRLFRQQTKGDWDGVIERVRQSLEQLASSVE